MIAQLTIFYHPVSDVDKKSTINVFLNNVSEDMKPLSKIGKTWYLTLTTRNKHSFETLNKPDLVFILSKSYLHSNHYHFAIHKITSKEENSLLIEMYPDFLSDSPLVLNMEFDPVSPNNIY